METEKAYQGNLWAFIYSLNKYHQHNKLLSRHCINNDHDTKQNLKNWKTETSKIETKTRLPKFWAPKPKPMSLLFHLNHCEPTSFFFFFFEPTSLKLVPTIQRQVPGVYWKQIKSKLNTQRKSLFFSALKKRNKLTN